MPEPRAHRDYLLISTYAEIVQERVDSAPSTASEAQTLKTHHLLILRELSSCSTSTLTGHCTPSHAALS